MGDACSPDRHPPPSGLEARGSAEQERPIARLRFSLALEAEQRTSDGALALLQDEAREKK